MKAGSATIIRWICKCFEFGIKLMRQYVLSELNVLKSKNPFIIATCRLLNIENHFIFPCFCPYEQSTREIFFIKGNKGNLFYEFPPTTLSMSLAELRLASLEA